MPTCTISYILIFKQQRLSKDVMILHYSHVFAVQVRRHPLIDKMLPVTLYWHFFPWEQKAREA